MGQVLRRMRCSGACGGRVRGGLAGDRADPQRSGPRRPNRKPSALRRVAGRTEIRRATEAALKAVPRSAQPRDWQGDAKRRHFAFRLALLADLENDADAFIAAIHGGGMEGTHRLDVAERLIAANRPAEALAGLNKPRQRFEGDDLDGADTDLRVAALEAMGRKDEAQSVRWCHFERSLSAEHLRAYLKRLPDFEDFEAEQKALEVAAGHQQTERALAFLIEWRARDRADRLVRERLAALDGRFYEVLRPAAEALEEKFPEAASLLYRRLVESVLDRGSSKHTPTPRVISNPAHVSRRVCRRPDRLRPMRPSSPGCKMRMDGNMGSGG